MLSPNTLNMKVFKNISGESINGWRMEGTSSCPTWRQMKLEDEVRKDKKQYKMEIAETVYLFSKRDKKI